MPRQPRIALGGYVYHVLNRANGRARIFQTPEAYREFEQLLCEANEQFHMRILAYTLMPNHWHLLLYPREDTDMPDFMRWLSTTHAAKFRNKTKTVGEGHLYQGRYKSFVTDTDTHLLTVLKYIERNPVRAKLVTHPEDWEWGSAHRRMRGTPKTRALLAAPPTPLPHQYRAWVNDAEKSEELDALHKSVNKGTPFGAEEFLCRFNQAKKKQ
jgi:putative transposase